MPWSFEVLHTAFHAVKKHCDVLPEKQSLLYIQLAFQAALWSLGEIIAHDCCS